MQAWGILELDRVRNKLLGIHGCVGTRWMGRSMLGVQVMLPPLGVSFSALQLLSPKGRERCGRRGNRHRVTEGTAASATAQWCRNKGFWGFLSLKHFFFMMPGSGCCQDLQSVFPSDSAVSVVWSRAGGRRVCVPSPHAQLAACSLCHTPQWQGC